MKIISVNSKGQVTIPALAREKLGIQKGSKVEISLVGNHLELRLPSIHSATTSAPPKSGYGMIKSSRPAIPADFDPATLLKP